MSILGAEPITRRQYAAGARNASGVWVRGTSTDTTISGSVQPLSGVEAASLPEGERHRDWIKVYTAEALRPVSQHGAADGDRLVIDGITYEVRTIARERKIIPHYRAYAVRVQEGGS